MFSVLIDISLSTEISTKLTAVTFQIYLSNHYTIHPSEEWWVYHQKRWFSDKVKPIFLSPWKDHLATHSRWCHVSQLAFPMLRRTPSHPHSQRENGSKHCWNSLSFQKPASSASLNCCTFATHLCNGCSQARPLLLLLQQLHTGRSSIKIVCGRLARISSADTSNTHLND